MVRKGGSSLANVTCGKKERGDEEESAQDFSVGAGNGGTGCLLGGQKRE